MATNDFLTFATGAGANVMSQADWQALTQRLSGFQSGVAQSDQLNKAWRQASIMAALIGQFIANKSGQNAVDDGTTAALETSLIAAIKATATEQFTGTSQNLSAVGFQKFPGGLIIQWGSVASVSGSASTFTFPVAFPNAMLIRGAFSNDTGTTGIFSTVSTSGDTKVNMGVSAWTATNTRANSGLTSWAFALGY